MVVCVLTDPEFCWGRSHASWPPACVCVCRGRWGATGPQSTRPPRPGYSARPPDIARDLECPSPPGLSSATSACCPWTRGTHDQSPWRCPRVELQAGVLTSQDQFHYWGRKCLEALEGHVTLPVCWVSAGVGYQTRTHHPQCPPLAWASTGSQWTPYAFACPPRRREHQSCVCWWRTRAVWCRGGMRWQRWWAPWGTSSWCRCPPCRGTPCCSSQGASSTGPGPAAPWGGSCVPLTMATTRAHTYITHSPSPHSHTPHPPLQWLTLKSKRCGINMLYQYTSILKIQYLSFLLRSQDWGLSSYLISLSSWTSACVVLQICSFNHQLRCVVNHLC